MTHSHGTEPQSLAAPRTSWKRRVGCVAVFLVVAYAGWSILFFRCNPGDRVHVSFRHLPEGVRYRSIICETGGRLHHLRWYVRSVFFPMAMDPRACVHSIPDEGTHLAVEWTQGHRYGILVRHDKTWRVFWFAEDQVVVQGRQFYFGGGKVEFDLEKGIVENMLPDQIQDLGLKAIEKVFDL